MAIIEKPVEYFDQDKKCIGYMVYDDVLSGKKPCVLINHAWSGLDQFSKNKALEIANKGYIGFCLDNYGNGYEPAALEDKQNTMLPLKEDRAKLLKRLLAGLEKAKSFEIVDKQNIATLGFCFGGLCALDIARSGADIKAAISFHGLLDAPNLSKNKIKAKILVAHGWDDPMATPNDVLKLSKELTESGCDWQLHAYGKTTHAFMVPGADSGDGVLKHNSTSENRAWSSALDLINASFSEV